MSAVFASIWSLRGSRAFADARVGSRPCRHGRLVIQHTRSELTTPVTLGLIVGRPVGNAVQRNRVRRQLKALIREAAPDLGGMTVVIRALPGSYEQSFDQLRSSLSRCLPVSSVRHAKS